MHIHLETNTHHSIQAYSNSSVQILSQTYHTNILVGAHFLITDWQINGHSSDAQQNASEPIDSQSVPHNQLTLADLSCCMRYQPRLILLGANHWRHIMTPALKKTLEDQQIAVEAMPIGAACRTFNVLLSEQREVILGIIFN